MPDEPLVQSTRFPSSPRGFVVSENKNIGKNYDNIQKVDSEHLFCVQLKQ